MFVSASFVFCSLTVLTNKCKCCFAFSKDGMLSSCTAVRVQRPPSFRLKSHGEKIQDAESLLSELAVNGTPNNEQTTTKPTSELNRII